MNVLLINGSPHKNGCTKSADNTLCIIEHFLATQMPCRTPSRSEALRSATDALRRLLARRSAGAVLKPLGGNCAVLPKVLRGMLQ